MSREAPARLTAADYAVFGVTLGISAVIGIFFAFKDRKSSDGTEGYMMGGRLVLLNCLKSLYLISMKIN